MELEKEHKLFTYKVSRFIHGFLTKHTGEVLFPDNIEIVLKQPSVDLHAHKDIIEILYLLHT
jgi:hypothetical protein